MKRNNRNNNRKELEELEIKRINKLASYFSKLSFEYIISF